MRSIAILAILAVFPTACTSFARSLAPPIRWDGQIHWQSYESALTSARAERKPAMLVFYADWCEPCKKQHWYFEDPRVVERAKKIVMVHVNIDHREDLAQRYRLGGAGLPRIYFVTPDGTILKGVHGPGFESRFNYGADDPGLLVAAMDAALRFTPASDVPPGVDLSAPTAAESCTPEPGESACMECVKARCCGDILAVLDHDATSALLACGAARCVESCPKLKLKLKGTPS